MDNVNLRGIRDKNLHKHVKAFIKNTSINVNNNNREQVLEKVQECHSYRHFVPVEMGGITCNALLDSGNTLFTNAISEKFCRKLGFSEGELIPTPYLSVGTAKRGDTLKVLGLLPKVLYMTIGGSQTKFKTQPLVIRNLSNHMNISGPFMCHAGIDQIHSSGAIRVNGKMISLLTDNEVKKASERTQKGINSLSVKSVKVFTDKEVIVPGNSAMFIPLRVPHADNLNFIKQEGLDNCGVVTVEKSFMNKHDVHSNIQCIARIEKSRTFSSVMNTLSEPIRIKRGEYFGKFTPITNIKTREHLLLPYSVGIIDVDVTKDKPMMKNNATKEEVVKKFKLQHLNKEEKTIVCNLLTEFDDLFHDVPGTTELVTHEINLSDDVPVKVKGRPINPILEKDLKQQLDGWLENGIVEESSSPWSFPMIPIQRCDKKIRWVIDFRKLNEKTIRDEYPIPNMEANLSKLARSKIFSTIDAVGAYHHVPIRKADRHLTAFQTPFGQYQFVKMPFGLHNAPSTYCRLVQKALGHLPAEVCLPYLDDILIHSNNFQNHIDHLRKVLLAHRKAGLHIKPEKCQLFQSEVKYLGHLVTENGIKPVEEYTKIVSEWPLPQTTTELKQFLGKISYYRKFIKDYGRISGPLSEALKGREKGQKLTITREFVESFEEAKKALTSAPILAYPRFDEPFLLDTDFSLDPGAMGAVLSQIQDGEERVIAYGARKLTESEKKYSSLKGELASGIYFINKFRYYLLPKKFTWRTDNSALKWLRSLKNPSGMVLRWLETLASYDVEVQHRAGKKHINADTLSRVKHADNPTEEEERESNQESPISLCAIYLKAHSAEDIVEKQKSDDVIGEVYKWVEKNEKPSKEEIRSKSPEFQTYMGVFEQLGFNKHHMLIRKSTGDDNFMEERICIPESLIDFIIRNNHRHTGMNTTAQRVEERYFIPFIRKRCEEFVRTCVECQAKSNAPKSQKDQLASVIDGYPFQRICLDFVGPLPPGPTGNTHILTIKDTFTRYVEAIPTNRVDAKTVVNILINDIISRYGFPTEIHTDQGAQFRSKLFEQVCEELGIKKTMTPPYNPKSNPVERTHRDLWSYLRSEIPSGKENEWEKYLPGVLLTIRTTRNRMTGVTPFEALFGRKAVLPTDVVFGNLPESKENVSEYAIELRKRLSKMYDNMRKRLKVTFTRARQSYSGEESGIKNGDLVWLYTPKKKLQRKWTGPWLVTKEISKVLRQITSHGKWVNRGPITITVTIDRLKKYQGEPIPQGHYTKEDFSTPDEFAEELYQEKEEETQSTSDTTRGMTVDFDALFNQGNDLLEQENEVNEDNEEEIQVLPSDDDSYDEDQAATSSKRKKNSSSLFSSIRKRFK